MSDNTFAKAIANIIKLLVAIALLLNVEFARSPQIFTKTLAFLEELCYGSLDAGV